MVTKLKYEIELSTENAHKIEAINKIILCDLPITENFQKQSDSIKTTKKQKIKDDVVLTESPDQITTLDLISVDSVKMALKAFAQSKSRDDARAIMVSNGASALSELVNCNQDQLRSMLSQLTSQM